MTQSSEPIKINAGIAGEVSKSKYIMISGVYPHLATFNEGGGLPCSGNGNENGIGAITPWAGKLWMVTYSPHCPGGSSDKLYSITENLEINIFPQSVGGTPANRMIHKESNQLITGPYLIDSTGKVRVIPPSVMPGRMTATARHLTDPANKVYFLDMEGMLYEADVHNLAVTKLFNKPVPGWHAKGAYTAQGQFLVANNGEHKVFDIKPGDLQAGGAPKTKDEIGVLASWNGKDWKIVERKQFTDITGPGGIYGEPNNNAPAWSIGWDKRSVILKLLDNGNWFTYRLPKATHTYDHWGGWYTEWPRIREIGNNKMLMDMHGMFYDFPKTFSRNNSAGISPISTHLRYIPDFCNWNGQLVLATDETTILQNPYAGRSQSNLWFGKPDDLKEWGPVNGWGGVWINDDIKAGDYSDPFMMSVPGRKVLHLSHNSSIPVDFTLEVDKLGNNQWTVYKKLTVAAEKYEFFILPQDLKVSWIRIKTNRDCQANAFFHFTGKGHNTADDMFTSLSGIEDKSAVNASIIRPARHNKNLQIVQLSNAAEKNYYEVNEKLEYIRPAYDSGKQVQKIISLKKGFETDDASVIIKDQSGTFRLPKTSSVYDQPFESGWPRTLREIESERSMFNAHGTLYEVPREAGFSAMKPVTTHKKKIVDFCTWRGLLVISGTKKDAKKDGHYFNDAQSKNGLWFGAVDDLWKLGKPTGEGGVWKNTNIKAGESSLPYLMTGYDKKTLSLTADKDVTITLEVDFDHNGWHTYKKVTLKAGENFNHVFPDGYSAHWIRATADKDCKATLWLKYE